MNNQAMTNGGIAVAVSTLLAWAVREFGDIEIPAEVGAALATIVGFFVGWRTPTPPAMLNEAPE
jgi:hypothetical protein